MEQWPKYKTEKEIEKQVKDAEDNLGTELVPELIDYKNLSLNEIKEKFPERYNTYLRILRSERNNKEIEESELNEMREWIQALNNLDHYIIKHKNNHEERILREKQFDVFKDIRKSLEEGKKEGYVKLPTGVGKTVLFSQVVESMGIRTLIIVPSKILINQTGQRLEEFTDLEFGKYYQEEKDFSKSATTITYQSLIRGVENGEINPDDYKLLILDEAHKALGEKTLKIIQRFNSIKLGFTATPEYSKNKRLGDLLEHEIHNISVVEAVQEGLINRFKSVVARTTTDISNVKIKNGEYDKKELETVVNNHARNLAAVDLYRKSFNNLSTIIYCSGVKHAQDTSDLFRQNGIQAEVISGKTDKEEREIILNKFRDGEIKVLCNAKVLVEGFDEPRASVAFNLQPTLSIVIAEQRAGRVLRLDKNNPEKWGVVVDFIDANAKVPPIIFAEVAGSSEATEYKVSNAIEKEREKKVIQTTKTNQSDFEQDEFENLKNIKIEGLKVIVDAQEILRIAADQKNEREKLFSEFPQDWLPLNQLIEELGVARKTVTDYVEQYRNNHPDWFKMGKFKSGKLTEGYHPNLVALIREKFKENLLLENLPNDFLTPNQIIGKFKINRERKTIANYAEKYRNDHPEWFKVGKKMGNKVEAYHPDLVKIISDYFKDKELPTNWITSSQLSNLLKVTEPLIRAYAEKYRNNHPEWIKVGKSGVRDAIAYHPDLIEKIKKHLFVEELPDKWKTASQILGELKSKASASLQMIKYLAEQYRNEHPDWFKTGKIYSKITEGYNPTLVELIKNHLLTLEFPDGWKTASQIRYKTKTDIYKIQDYVEQYRNNHSNWFKMGRVRGKSAEGYHPDLVKIIEEYFKRNKNP